MKILLVLIAILMMSSCQKNKPYDLRSPCVSGENGPCDRRPVNAWMNSTVV